jgi:hypothetical protein
MSVSYESYWSANMMIDCSLNRGCNKHGFIAIPSPMSPDKLLLLGLGPQEGQEISIHLILMRSRDAVRCTRIVDFLRALDEPRRLRCRVLDRNDLVVLAVHDQSRDIDLLEVLGEISLRECLDALVGVLEAGLHAPEPELIQYALGDIGPRPIGTVELCRQVLVELRAVLRKAAPHVVEDLDRKPLRIGRGFQHKRRHCSDEHHFRDSLLSVAADVADDLAAARGVAHKYGILEIECLNHGRKIVGIAVHVIPRRGLARPAMATTIVRNHAEPVLGKEKHLTVPGVGAQRPTVRERYDRAFAPVLVVNFGSVLGGNRACTHGMNFSIIVKLDLRIVILLKLLLISFQRKRNASQYIKGPQRN